MGGHVCVWGCCDGEADFTFEHHIKASSTDMAWRNSIEKMSTSPCVMVHFNGQLGRIWSNLGERVSKRDGLDYVDL